MSTNNEEPPDDNITEPENITEQPTTSSTNADVQQINTAVKSIKLVHPAVEEHPVDVPTTSTSDADLMEQQASTSASAKDTADTSDQPSTSSAPVNQESNTPPAEDVEEEPANPLGTIDGGKDCLGGAVCVFYTQSPFADSSPHPFILDGRYYFTLEHYFNAQMLISFGMLRCAAKAIRIPSPRLMRKCVKAELKELLKDNVFDEKTIAKWKVDNGPATLRKGNRAKFEQNFQLKSLLMHTGERVLVFASPTDRLFGVGMCEGELLMWAKKNMITLEDLLDVFTGVCGRPLELGQNALGIALMEVRADLLRTTSIVLEWRRAHNDELVKIDHIKKRRRLQSLPLTLEERKHALEWQKQLMTAAENPLTPATKVSRWSKTAASTSAEEPLAVAMEPPTRGFASEPITPDYPTIIRRAPARALDTAPIVLFPVESTRGKEKTVEDKDSSSVPTAAATEEPVVVVEAVSVEKSVAADEPTADEATLVADKPITEGETTSGEIRAERAEDVAGTRESSGTPIPPTETQPVDEPVVVELVTNVEAPTAEEETSTEIVAVTDSTSSAPPPSTRFGVFAPGSSSVTATVLKNEKRIVIKKKPTVEETMASSSTTPATAPPAATPSTSRTVGSTDDVAASHTKVAAYDRLEASKVAAQQRITAMMNRLNDLKQTSAMVNPFAVPLIVDDQQQECAQENEEANTKTTHEAEIHFFYRRPPGRVYLMEKGEVAPLGVVPPPPGMEKEPAIMLPWRFRPYDPDPVIDLRELPKANTAALPPELLPMPRAPRGVDPVAHRHQFPNAPRFLPSWALNEPIGKWGQRNNPRHRVVRAPESDPTEKYGKGWRPPDNPVLTALQRSKRVMAEMKRKRKFDLARHMVPQPTLPDDGDSTFNIDEDNESILFEGRAYPFGLGANLMDMHELGFVPPPIRGDPHSRKRNKFRTKDWLTRYNNPRAIIRHHANRWIKSGKLGETGKYIQLGSDDEENEDAQSEVLNFSDSDEDDSDLPPKVQVKTEVIFVDTSHYNDYVKYYQKTHGFAPLPSSGEDPATVMMQERRRLQQQAFYHYYQTKVGETPTTWEPQPEVKVESTEVTPTDPLALPLRTNLNDVKSRQWGQAYATQRWRMAQWERSVDQGKEAMRNAAIKQETYTALAGASMGGAPVKYDTSAATITIDGANTIAEAEEVPMKKAKKDRPKQLTDILQVTKDAVRYVFSGEHDETQRILNDRGDAPIVTIEDDSEVTLETRVEVDDNDEIVMDMRAPCPPPKSGQVGRVPV